ncbi:unnamed protein product [Ranitomeya imitator]|uniref:Uncharacterized protein n=1 Tax=Ranitomeya imitator TaxID=111125 RepID=A0ABN9KQ95_9NEOB|nr:unnamed protein product [Ranitomeya imitator]
MRGRNSAPSSPGHRLGSGCVEKLQLLPTLCTIFTTCVGMSGRRIATAPYRPEAFPAPRDAPVTGPCIAVSLDDDVAVSQDRYVIISRDRNALLGPEHREEHRENHSPSLSYHGTISETPATRMHVVFPEMMSYGIVERIMRSSSKNDGEYLMKLTMEDLIEFLQESLAKNFGYEDDYVIEQLQLSMTELRRAKLDLPPPVMYCEESAHRRLQNGSRSIAPGERDLGKDDEQPKKTLGLIPSEPAQILANHVMNGQKSTGKLPNQIKPEKVNSPSKAPQASPTEKRRKNSIDKSTLKSIKRESGEYRTEHFKTNGHNRKFPQPVTPTQDKVKYYDHAAANQNSNATSSSSKGIAPKWNLPSESKNKELLLKHMSDVRAIPQNIEFQYDNVSGGENEIDNHIEDSRQQSDLSDKNVMYFNSTSSQIPFKGSSPSRTTESNSAFGMQPRSPGRSTPFQGTGDGYKQPPPSYSSPPLYQNNAKYSLSRLNSGHHSPTRIGQSNMSYDDSFDFPSDKIPMNSTGRQNPVTSPSNRIEVLPAEENATLRLGNFNQRENHRYIVIPPIDYQLDHTFVPEVSFGTFGQPLNREASRSYLSNLQKSPGSYQPSSPVTNFSSLSVNSPVRLRTSPHNEQVTPPRYLHSKPGAPHFRNHRDGLIMHESVML